MAKFTNISPEDRDVYIDGAPRFVPSGESFDVPDQHADGYRLQPHFKEVEQVKKTKENV